MSNAISGDSVGLVERLLALRSVPAFGGFPDRELAVLGSHARLLGYPRGGVIIARDERLNHIIVPVRGDVAVARAGKPQADGDALNAGLGLLSVLAERPSNIEVVATSPTVVMAIGRSALSDALEDDFQMSARLLSRLAQDMVDELRRNPHDTAIPTSEVPPLRVAPTGDLDLVERLLVLRPSRVFRAASLDGVAQFAKLLKPVTYAKGELLWRERDRSTGLLVIVDGVVACRHPASSAVTRYRSTGLVGAIDVLSGDKRWATARCETDVRALWADGEVLLDVLEDNFELTVNLLGFIAERTLALRGASSVAPAPTGPSRQK